jgi:hypothetical protein
MSRGKHRKPGLLRNAGLAAGAGLSVLVLTTGVAAAAPEPTASCVDDTDAYHAAQLHEQDTAKALNAARDADTAARETQTKAKTDAKAKYSDAVAAADKDLAAGTITKAQRDARVRVAKREFDDAVAAADKAYAEGGTAGKLAAAQAAEDAAVADRDAKHATAEKSCTGKPGTTLIDTTVVLKPGVCARALVRPDRTIVKVIVAVPCPTDDKPAAQPGSEQSSPTMPAAPAPETVQTHLPVTH